MSSPVIKVENLSKRFIISHEARESYQSLRDVISLKAKNAFFSSSKIIRSTEEFWALKDLNFDVNQGDRVGIIGRNGAGKSTLLKILSRITEPTKGRITIDGKVASLLEVGTGFHPELTGRENIFLNGAILGMKRPEIRRKFDEIVAFAEVEKFLDTPVKRYSSGMYVRLAFAVAANLEPEILIVDEVLAVGDAQFQKKCLGKMEDVSKNEGRTVLFVSHNMQSIATLTNKCIILLDGKIHFEGLTHDSINQYLSNNKPRGLEYFAQSNKEKPNIVSVSIQTSNTNNVHIFGNPLVIKIKVWTPRSLKGASLSFQILNNQDVPIIHLWSFDSERPMCGEPGFYALDCRIEKLRLYMGEYTLKVHFSGPPMTEKFETLENVCPFTVEMYNSYREFEFVPGTCTYVEDAVWSVNRSQ